jgi:hypothetical protein
VEINGEFFVSLLSGTSIFPIIAVSTTPTAMYREKNYLEITHKIPKLF